MPPTPHTTPADDSTAQAGEPATSPRLLFLRKFLTHGTRVASVAPSSRSLCRALCGAVRTDRPQTIVELGAGSGAVTRELAERAHPDSRIVALEIDADFAAAATRSAPRAEVICDDVTRLAPRMQQLGITGVDLVISGLPTPSLPKPVSAAVFDWVATLGPDVTFSQLTVMPWVYQRMYRRLFERVEFELVMSNVPPGGAYHCQRLRRDYHHHLPGK